MWKELIKKIELQSVLVLLLTLGFGYLLLSIDNSLNSPAGVLGSISIIIGLLYTFGSFFSNQIKESYKDVILEYKEMANNLKSSSKTAQDFLKNTMTEPEQEKIAGFQALSDQDSETKNN